MILKIIGSLPTQKFPVKRKTRLCNYSKMAKIFEINYKNFISKILFEKLKCHSKHVAKISNLGIKEKVVLKI